MDTVRCLVFALLCLGVVIAQDTEVTIDVATKTVNEGEDIVLVCTSSLGYEMDWDHNGLTLENGKDRVIIAVTDSGTAKVSTLTRTGATWMDKGTYKCMDQDDFFSIYDEAEVEVNKGAAVPSSHVTIDPSENIVKKKGESVMISCTCSMGSDLSWFLYDSELSEGPGITISEAEVATTKTTMLTLDEVSSVDSGVYSCRGDSGTGPQVLLTVVDPAEEGKEVDDNGDDNSDDAAAGGVVASAILVSLSVVYQWL